VVAAAAICMITWLVFVHVLAVTLGQDVVYNLLDVPLLSCRVAQSECREAPGVSLVDKSLQDRVGFDGNCFPLVKFL
jgi:hypothetical protein